MLSFNAMGLHYNIVLNGIIIAYNSFD